MPRESARWERTSRRFGIWVLLVFTLHACSDLFASDPTSQLAYDSLQPAFARLDCPGACVGCFDRHGDEILLYSLSDPARVTARIERDHKVRIASLSKMFIGHALLKASDRTLVRLDDAIGQYVQGVPRGDQITLRMLGRHLSGLGEPIATPELQDRVMKSPGRDWAIEELLPFAYSHRPSAQLGEFYYSNANVLLLAKALQVAHGQPYRDVVRRQILDPWGLKDSGFAPGELPLPHGQSFRFGKLDRVIGYGNVFYDVTNYGAGWTSAAGDMYSTIDDLALALPRLTLGEGLSEVAKAELHQWGKSDWGDTEYSFLMENVGGWLGHTGNVPGYNVAAHYCPEVERSVIAITNLSNCSDKRMPAEELAKVVRDLVDSVHRARLSSDASR